MHIYIYTYRIYTYIYPQHQPQHPALHQDAAVKLCCLSAVAFRRDVDPVPDPAIPRRANAALILEM